ncbi:ubiquinone/menaquinone biosynthesis C-methylase UbiE [Clostridium saccharoperbutylacetonicum]|uniref:Methyltransferase domain-containing protein n=1 Tax=Clostridium saccharoperbutylacetonicum N1-4(HMT) TaxID=931276 RepID=M1N4D2_9CLOT|nr:hypothetical protein [Clostridium saccharoperbutylacetonicum]AGF58292.1 hypothetical protein Cspa_c45390 [Clostridium saccharoperbutylacetonicum N1-4(HMT)]NRT60931.1 ubiquinone/menaquinone biosynthesis C-methylase UbiE [Clostridium saccharoperbutylacetonicum]NSB24244.1 ubiquinone/menaquinone biosynthesis C-methylase UbiE [Clostridium saccharoperbutylacetonicum]NSB43622.1 ubiquinone/menaquinone biosynthesis C-methylase UbiE [Clostridium saccharoperbutylacetonicum]
MYDLKNINTVKQNLTNRKVILFGASTMGKECAESLKRMNVPVYKATDNSPGKWNQKLNDDVDIFSYEDFVLEVKKNISDYIVIISSSFCAPILSQLQVEFDSKCLIYSYTIIEELYSDFICNSKENRYEIDFDSQMDTWVNNLLSEVYFWNSEVARKGSLFNLEYLDRCQVKEFKCDRISKKFNEGDIVLDVGCGLCTKYGNKINGIDINLIPVDPLAYYYDKINKKVLDEEIYNKIKIKFGMFEFLSYFFEENFADVILIDNALDHCIDPLKSLLECLKVTKINYGIVSIKHSIREAVNENYTGLHKWNIDINSDNELVFWNKENFVNINKLLKDYIEIEVIKEGVTNNFYGYVTANITKKKEIIIDEIININDNLRLSKQIEKLMKIQSDLNYYEEYKKIISD